jgi:hypothetical protein
MIDLTLSNSATLFEVARAGAYNGAVNRISVIPADEDEVRIFVFLDERHDPIV